jgi:hypothetical protein
MTTGENGVSLADIAAVTNGNKQQEWLLPLILLSRGNGGILGGGNCETASVAGAAAVNNYAAMRDQVNTVLAAVHQNADIAANAQLKEAVCHLGTLVQQSGGAITAAICECCCKMSQMVCDLGYKTQAGLADVRHDLCDTDALVQREACETRTQATMLAYQGQLRESECRLDDERRRTGILEDKISNLEQTIGLTAMVKNEIKSALDCAGLTNGCSGCGSCNSNGNGNGNSRSSSSADPFSQMMQMMQMQMMQRMMESFSAGRSSTGNGNNS